LTGGVDVTTLEVPEQRIGQRREATCAPTQQPKRGRQPPWNCHSGPKLVNPGRRGRAPVFTPRRFPTALAAVPAYGRG